MNTTEIGALGIIVVFLIKEIFSYLKSLRNNKNNTNNLEQLRSILILLKENELQSLEKKTDKILEKLEIKFDETINLLKEIKFLMNKNK